MKRSRFSDEQVIGILKEQEAGSATADVCRRHIISSATFYKWKAIYGPPPVRKGFGHDGRYGLHQSIRPSGGAIYAPGHDGIRTPPSRLSYAAS
jgi:hypothetical protein